LAGDTVCVIVALPESVWPPGSVVDEDDVIVPGPSGLMTVDVVASVWPFGRVLVAEDVTFPGATVVVTARSTLLPLGPVNTCCLSHVPGATLVSVDANVTFFPLASVMVPPEETTPGAVFAEVPCHVDVFPFGRVAVPPKVPDFVALSHLPWDCQVPVPPAAFVHEPFVLAAPFSRVVVEEATPDAPVLEE
jgi:hypothetical protein